MPAWLFFAGAAFFSGGVFSVVLGALVWASAGADKQAIATANRPMILNFRMDFIMDDTGFKFQSRGNC